MDLVSAIVGALVIANWSYGLLRDTGGILLDLHPDDIWRTKFAMRLKAMATS